MKIILSSDVELWSWRGDFQLDIEQPLAMLCDFLAKERIPASLFLSLSDKGLQGCENDYFVRMRAVSHSLIDNRFVEVGIHTHCQNLPLAFRTDSDYLSGYSPQQMKTIINWYVRNTEELLQGRVYLHRAAGYQIPHKFRVQYDEMLAAAGILYDSSDLCAETATAQCGAPVRNIPPSTLPEMARRRQVWSPDTMTFEQLISFYRQWPHPVIVMNFHSFLLADRAIYRPGSVLLNIWFGLPPIAKRLLGQPLQFVKQIYRNQNRSDGDGTNTGLALLKRIVHQLKQDGGEFIRFSDL